MKLVICRKSYDWIEVSEGEELGGEESPFVVVKKIQISNQYEFNSELESFISVIIAICNRNGYKYRRHIAELYVRAEQDESMEPALTFGMCANETIFRWFLEEDNDET